MTRYFTIVAAAIGLLAAGPALGSLQDPERWADYLDFAYVYSSADAAALQARLDEYSKEAGVSLETYLSDYLGTGDGDKVELDEAKVRRKAVGYLLTYLSTRDPKALDLSVDTIDFFAEDRGRFEDRYWYHYIRAHDAMERGNATEFVRENLDLWMNVVVPLESSFDTLEALSLSQSPSSGFVSALPYVFENISRLILIRSQERGLNRDLDPLAAVVRMLDNGRVGAHPEVIPPEASSAEYVDHIVNRLNGTESDDGSLTFTLLLFEAGKYHERARGLLASEGLSEDTIKAVEVASGAYRTALDRAETLQGEAAVYVRVLRQLGELYAAKQRLGVDPSIETPFDIEDAIDLYDRLFDVRAKDEWKEAGFKRAGYDAYVEAMHRLWQEIQETTLNISDYYLARSLKSLGRKEDYVRSAAQMYDRYLSFFERYAGPKESDFLPDSAYFAAYECAKGYGDAFLKFSGTSTSSAEEEMVVQRYLTGLGVYPFDGTLWSSLSAALERRGRSNDYLLLSRPLADRVVRSRHVDAWIRHEEPGTKAIATQRRALSDDLVLMYLGFAAGSGMEELEQSLEQLREEYSVTKRRLAELSGQNSPGPASPDPSAEAAQARPLATQRAISRTTAQLAKLERKIDARSKALPLYEATLESGELIRELRSQRDHPVHTLLRRMYFETRAQNTTTSSSGGGAAAPRFLGRIS